MMYGELYQYFILHKHLSVPGIGTFLLERKPASSDFPNRLVLPPAYSISLHRNGSSPSKHFFGWLAAALRTSDRDAIIRFNDFAFDMKKQLDAGSEIEWSGLGILSKGIDQDTKFDPVSKEFVFETPVVANKVIREKAEHSVRVGEEEKTSAEMRDYFSQTTEKKQYWWAWSLVLGFLLILFIGWYFSEHGLRASSAANTQKLKPGIAAPSYKPL